MSLVRIGRWSFVLGVLIAIMIGFVTFDYATLVLVILGIIVGFLNVSSKEQNQYLVAVIALLVIGFAGLQVFAVLGGGLVEWFQTVLTSFITFVAASGLVVALREIIVINED